MARILTTAFIADIRNSVAGTTFSKGRYGNYCKAKTSGSKQNSQYQNAWRNIQATVAGIWKQISESQRQGWVDASSNFPQVDKFGSTFYLSGFSLYQQLNLNLQLGANARIDDAPAPQDVEAILDYAVSVTWDMDAEIWSIVIFAAAPVSSGTTRIMIYATQPGSPGQMAIGKTVYFVQSGASAVEEHDVSESFNTFFGVPGAGQKVFFSMNFLSTISGQVSVRQNQSIIFPNYIVSVEGVKIPADGEYYTFVFGQASNVVPAGYKIVMFYDSGDRPAPSDPTGLTWAPWQTAIAGVNTSPFFSGDSGLNPGTKYLWAKFELTVVVTNQIVTTAYSLILY